jgi:amidohydrolase
MRTIITLLTLGLAGSAAAQTPNPLAAEIDARVDQALPSIIEWRRDLHQHPELGNREFRTAKVIAGHLERLGLEVQTGVAHTGVVGVLKGGLPGPVAE